MCEPREVDAADVEDLTVKLDAMLMQWLPWAIGLHDMSVEGSRRAYEKRLRPVREFATWLLQRR